MEELFATLVPPVLLGVGVVIPVAVKANPFEIPAGVKMLAMVVFALLTWIAYFLALGLAHVWRYSEWMTILSALVATLLLFLVLVTAWRRKGQLKNVRYFCAFATSIFLLALASANWIGQKGKVLIRVESNRPIKDVAARSGGESARFKTLYADPSGRENVVWLVLSSKEFDAIQTLMLNEVPTAISNLVPVVSGFPARRYELKG